MLQSLRKLVIIALAFIGALYVAITVTPITAWWTRGLAGPWNDPGGDILIVLGGDPTSIGMIGQGSYWRAVYGVRAWRTGGFKTFVISGGGDIGPSIRALVICQAVPAQAIQLEQRSTSTRENALFTRELLSRLPGRKVLRTSDFHMFRAAWKLKYRACGILFHGGNPREGYRFGRRNRESAVSINEDH